MGVKPKERMTHRVIKKVAYETSRSSHPEAAMALEHQAGIKVSQAECFRISQQYGRLIEQMIREKEASWNAPYGSNIERIGPEFIPDYLVIEADATAVLTVSGEEHKMVYNGTAFDLSCRLKGEEQRPEISERKYCASGGSFEEFVESLKALANRMGYGYANRVAFIGDGAPSLWKMAKDLFPNAVLIQDIWHVKEHLFNLGKEIYGESKAETAVWIELLKEGKVDAIIKILDQERKIRRGRKRKRLEEEIHYLQAGKTRMDYPIFKEEGWPIGSGAIEGTCKHLVKERFNKTGARWKRKNISNMLALRVSIFNDDWESHWSKLRAA